MLWRRVRRPNTSGDTRENRASMARHIPTAAPDGKWHCGQSAIIGMAPTRGTPTRITSTTSAATTTLFIGLKVTGLLQKGQRKQRRSSGRDSRLKARARLGGLQMVCSAHFRPGDLGFCNALWVFTPGSPASPT